MTRSLSLSNIRNVYLSKHATKAALVVHICGYHKNAYFTLLVKYIRILKRWKFKKSEFSFRFLLFLSTGGAGKLTGPNVNYLRPKFTNFRN
jgi:hypothetical protein